MNKTAFYIILIMLLLDLGCSKVIFPRHLYAYWAVDIEKAPFIVQVCLQNIKMACAQSQWKFTLITDQNLPEHIPDYYQRYQPVRISGKHNSDWTANVADLVRLAVLQQKGGMYLDLSVILLRGLDWATNLQRYPYILTNSELHQGKQPDVMLPYLTHYQNMAQYRDPDKGIVNLQPGYETWCFLGKANSTLIKDFRNRHIHHYTHTKQENEEEDLRNGQYLHGIYDDYLDVQRSIYQLIQQKQFELDKNLTLFGGRISANNYYKIVSFRAEYGPYAFVLDLLEKDKVFTHTVEQIYEQSYIPLFFMVKMTHGERPRMEYLFKRLIELAKIFGNITENFTSFLASKPSANECYQTRFIVNGSVAGYLIQGNKVAENVKLSSITTEQREQWRQYCKNSFGIQLDTYPPKPDVKIKQLFDNEILPLFKKFLATSIFERLEGFLNQVAIFCAESLNGFYGGFSDVHQTYYWRKVFEQRHPDIKNPTPNPDNQFVPTRQISNYSTIQLFKLRIKLYFIANKTVFAYEIKVFIYFFWFIFKVSVVFLMIASLIKLKTKISAKACNSQQKTFMWKKIIFLIKESIQSIILKIQNALKKLKGQDFTGKKQFVLELFYKIAKYRVRKLLITIICVAFIAFNAIIFFKYYYIIFLGKLYYQEPFQLLYILIQISFRLIFKKIGYSEWGLPGITLQQILKFFSPVYIFYLGASILVMAERTQVRNLALSASLCMIIPVLISQIQLQLKKTKNFSVLQQFVFNIEKPILRIFADLALKIFTNLNRITQIITIIFLFLNIVMPNLRFLVYNDQIYLIKMLSHKLESFVAFFFLTLISLILLEIYIAFFKKQNCMKIMEVEQQTLNHRSKKFYYSDFQKEYTEKEQNHKKFSSRSKNYNVHQRYSSDNNGTFHKIFFTIYNGLKIWLYYKLVFTEWSEILIRNTLKVRYSQSVNALEYYINHLSLMRMIFIFFVSFELEKIVVQNLMPKRSSDQQQFQEHQVKLAQKNHNPNQISQKEKKQYFDSLNNITKIMLSIFLGVQFFLVYYFLAYLTTIDEGNQSLKDKLESNFEGISIVTGLLCLISFKVAYEMVINKKYILTQQQHSMLDENISFTASEPTQLIESITFSLEQEDVQDEENDTIEKSHEMWK